MGCLVRDSARAFLSPRGAAVLVEKEIISDGTYWYLDQKTGIPRKLTVTPELRKHWHGEGNKMLAANLPIPVPCEHDFNAHPMTPKDALLNNAGWVKEYRNDGKTLSALLNIEDEDIAKKLPRTIRWTSPWFNSFTDGTGKKWDNVISHLALTTRPRVVDQQPFGSIAAALSLATETNVDASSIATGTGGFCLSRAGRLYLGKRTKRLHPCYPMAFSMYAGGVRLGPDDMMQMDDVPDEETSLKKKKKKKTPLDSEGGKGGGGGSGTTDDDSGGDDDFGGGDDLEGGAGDTSDMGGLMNPLQDSGGDVKMEELLCDLLTALGIQMPEVVGESEFKRALYEAAMTKIKELTSKAQSESANAAAAGANTTSPAGGGQQNPLIQQEQQPMYMSLEDITKIPDPTMRTIALSMYNENVKLRGELDTNSKKTASLEAIKLKEAGTRRAERCRLLSKVSPRVKADLDAMLAAPAMALSMGDGGAVVDPMDQTLSVLEKGIGDMPRLLTSDNSTFSVQPQPTDGEMGAEEEDALADSMARQMGCAPVAKK